MSRTDRTTSASTATASGPPKGVLFVLAMCGGFAPFAIDAYLPGLPQIASEFGTEASLVQFTLTGFMVALGLMQLVIGPLSDQLGRRKLFLIGVFGSAVASVICAIAPNIWILILARILQGAFGAAGVVLSRAIVADLSSGVGMAKAFSLLMSIQSLAPVLAPILGGIIVPNLGWRAVFWFLAALSCSLGLAAIFLVRETLPPELRQSGGPRAAARDMATLLRYTHFVAPMLMFAAVFMGMFAYISASPFILQRIVGLSETQFSIVFAVNSASILAANLISGRLVSRIRPLTIVVIASYVMVGAALWLAFAVLALDTSGWAICIGFFALVSTTGFLMPNIASATISAAGRRSGSGSALMGATQFLLAAISAPLTGIGDGTTALPFIVVLLVAVAIQQIVLRIVVKAYRVPLEREIEVDPAD